MAGLMESLNKSKTTTGGRGLMGSLVTAQNTKNVIKNATPQVATPTANKEDSENNGGFIGGLGYLGEKIGLGFLSGIEGIWDYTAGGIAKLFGADDWAEQQFANDWVNYNHADEWYNPSSGWQVAGDVAGGIGTSLPALVGVGIGAAVAYFSGGSLTPLAAGIISGSIAGLGAAGNATKEAYRETGELGGKEFGYGALSGATEAGVELLSAGMAKGSGRIVSSIAKSTSKEVAETVAKTGAKSIIKQLGEDFGQEALEEGLAEIVSPWYQRMTYNPDAKNATVQEIGYAALVGGLSGMVMSGSRVTIGAAVNTTQNYISGNNAVKNGTVESIMREGETLANAETKHQTGYEAFESVKETFEKLRVSLATTGGQVTTVHQKMLLGKLKGATTISRILPYVERSARGLVFSADVAAERYSTFGITDANGKPLKFTAEQLLEGVDTELLAKAKEGSLTDKEARTFALSLRKAIQTNPVLSTLAVAEATGQIILDTRKMAEASLNGQNLANAADLNYLIENGSQEEMDALAEAFGIEDWSKVTIDDFRAKMSEFNASGRISEYAEQSKRVHKAAEQASESAKPLPHLLRRNMTDGVYRYKSNDSAVDMAVIKEGDNYFLYDYEGRHISRALSMQDVNKVLKRFWTSGQTTTAKSMQNNQETTTARATAEVEALAKEVVGENYNKLNEPTKAAIRMTIRQAQAHGLSDVQVRTFAKVAARTGVNIIFDEQKALGDGSYSARDNAIYVNPKNSAERTYEIILGHEMFHAIFADGEKGALTLFLEAKKLIEVDESLVEKAKTQALTEEEAERFAVFCKDAELLEKARAGTLTNEDAQKILDNSPVNTTRGRYKNFYAQLGGVSATQANVIVEEEVAARGVEEAFKSEAVWDYILSKEPSFADKVLSFFRQSAREYSKLQGMSSQARKFIRQYKKLFDSLSEKHQGTNALALTLEGANAKKITATSTFDENMHVTGDNDEEAPATTNTDERYALPEALKSLGEYDATRIRHIESSGKDRVVRDYNEIKDFIKRSKSNPPFERLHIGIISDKTAALVKARTGEDITGYDFVLASNFVFHIYDSHGNEATEAPRGQKAVDDANIENIIEAVIAPDDVRLVSDSTGTALRFEKFLEGRNVAITITSTKKSTLTLKSAWIINEKSGGRTPSANANALAGTPEANSRSSTDNSITENAKKSNPSDENSSKKTPKKRFALTDEAYLAAVESGDMDTVQAMVDKAARNAGYTVKGYHGTGADFNIFSEEKVGKRNVWGRGFYFGTSKGIADDYASWRASKGGKYRIVSAYLKFNNPYIPSKSSIGSAEDILDRWFPDMWQTSRELGIGYIEGKLDGSTLDLLQFIAEHNNIEVKDVLAEYGYDGVKDGGEIVAFYSEQIKSADPITYDDAGKIIPLSKRFSPYSRDIRFALPETDSNGETLTEAQREYFADSKALDENGNLLALYHGTPKENGEFYVFDNNKAKRKGGFGFASSGKGFYFTTKREAAEIYTRSGGRLLSVYVDIKNPYIVNGDIKEQISNDFGIDPLNVYLQEVRRILSSKGYDGIIQGKGDARIVVAYYPEQIKLTSNKNPTADPDVRFALPETDSEGNPLSPEQREFFADTKVLDEKGNLLLVYHGTRKADFTKFKRNINYFTDNKDVAESYSPNGEMFEGYVKIINPYIVDAMGEKWSKIPINEKHKSILDAYGGSSFKEEGRWRSTTADFASAIQEMVENGDAGYDGVIIKNVDDTGSYWKIKEQNIGNDYIIFNSNQFKRSDNKKPTTDPDMRFALDIENIDVSWYNEIKLNGSEQNRIQSEALTWDAKHRNELRSRTLSNDIIYRYVIDDDGIVHVFEREKAKNIHEWREDYGNKGTKRFDRAIEGLRTRQRNDDSNSRTVQNRRESSTDDRRDNTPLRREGRSDGAGYSENRISSHGRSEAGIQGPYLKVVHTFNDITGRKRNILRVGSNKYMIEGDTRSKYQPTIAAVIKAENERIIDRYTKKKDKSKSFVKAKLAIDPDFLKGFKFALTSNEDLDALLSELYSDTSTVFDVEAILERGIPRKTGVSTLTIGEMKKTIANNTHYQVFSKGKALEVIGRMFGTSDLTAKTRAELADALWQGFNDCTDLESRQTFAHDMAEFIVAKMMTEAKVENPDIIEAQEKLTCLSTYIGKLTFSPQDISELRHIADRDGLRMLLGRWGYKGRMVSMGNGVAVPTKRVPMDVFVCDIAREMPDMADFENMHPAEAFIELDAIYERAKEDVKDKWISAYWEATDADMLAIVSGIEADIMRAFETEGEQSKFSRLVEGRIEYYSTRAEFWKAEHDRIKGRDRILGLLMSQAQKMNDLRIGKYKNSTQFESDLFRNSVEKLAKIKFRGNLNVSGTRKIFADLLLWYQGSKTTLLEYRDAENPGYYSEAIEEALRTIADGQGGFTKADLSTMIDVMGHFIHFVENYGKVWRSGQLVEALPLAQEYNRIIERNKSLKVGLFNKLAGSWYGELFLDPQALCERMDYYDHGFFSQMFEELRSAAKGADVAEMDIMSEYDAFLRENKKYIANISTETVEYRGHQIPKAQLIDLYMTMKRKQAWAGAAYNGFNFKNLKGDVERVDGFLTAKVETEEELETAIQAELDTIAKNFTDTDRAYMAIVERGYNERAKALKVERDMARMGYTNASNGYYYPISRAYTSKTIDADPIKAEFDRVSNASFNKDIVKGARQELALSSVDARYRRHIHAVCQYAYLSPTIETFNRLYNLDISGNKNHPVSVRTASENVWVKGNNYFKKLISDIQGIPTGSSEGMAALSFIRGSYAKYQLGANPKVWFTQLSSIFASTSILDYDCIVRGMGVSSSDIDTYCPLARLRNYDNTAAMAQGVLDRSGKAYGRTGKVMNKVGEVSDLLMKPIGMMDRFVVSRLFGACQVQVEKNGGAKVGTDENKIEAGKLLEKVIFETQQNSIATERSGAMRSSNEILRTLTMFTSDSMKVIGRVISAYGEVSVLKARTKAETDADAKAELQARLKKAQKKLAKSSAALAMTAIFMALIAQAFRWLYKKDDEEDNIPLNMTLDAVGNLFGGLPLVKDAYAKLVEGYDLDNYAYSAVNDLLDGAKNLMTTAGNVFSNEASSQEVALGIKNFIYSIGQATGIPVRNIYNVFYGLTKRFNGEAAYKIDSAFYAKNYQNDLYKAIEEEDAEMASFILSLLYNERMGVDMSEAVHSELYSLSAKGYKVIPKSAPSSITVNGQEYELSETEVAAIRANYSSSQSSLEALFNNESYNTLSDEMKAEAVNYVYDIYYDQALESVLGVNKGNAALLANLIGADSLALLYVATRGLESDKDKNGQTVSGSKRKKVVAAINKLKIPPQQKLLLICAKGYSLKDGDIRGYSAEKAEKYLLNYLLRQSSLTKEQKAELAVLCGFEVKNGKIVQKSSNKQN